MADYKVVYYAHFESSPRSYGRSHWTRKDFSTKWEAEKFLEEFRQKHWWADSGWVDSETIDLRSEGQKAYDEKVQERVSMHIEKMWRNWHGF